MPRFRLRKRARQPGRASSAKGCSKNSAVGLRTDRARRSCLPPIYTLAPAAEARGVAVFRGTAWMRIRFEAASAAFPPRERRVDRGL